MLTRDILFGMNILTLAGFVVMGLTLTLNRMGQTGKVVSIGLMSAGTALVFVGQYAGGSLWRTAIDGEKTHRMPHQKRTPARGDAGAQSGQPWMGGSYSAALITRNSKR